MKKFILLAVLAFTACSPVYKTKYTYQPPVSMEGGLCISECENEKFACESMCSSRQDDCEEQEKRDAKESYRNYVYFSKKNGDKPVPESKHYGTYCSVEERCLKDCNSNYNGCYTRCGGNITSSQKCTAFCDK